jgi:hypothetical protein
MAERISSQTTVWRNARKRVRKANSTVEKSNRESNEVGPDFLVENHGSIFLLQPLTPAANSWIDEHLPEDHLTFGGAVCVEHRFIRDIVTGIIGDGLVVS